MANCKLCRDNGYRARGPFGEGKGGQGVKQPFPIMQACGAVCKNSLAAKSEIRCI